MQPLIHTLFNSNINGTVFPIFRSWCIWLFKCLMTRPYSFQFSHAVLFYCKMKLPAGFFRTKFLRFHCVKINLCKKCKKTNWKKVLKNFKKRKFIYQLIILFFAWCNLFQMNQPIRTASAKKLDASRGRESSKLILAAAGFPKLNSKIIFTRFFCLCSSGVASNDGLGTQIRIFG